METTMTYQAAIRDIPTLKVAALAHRGDYMAIGSTFERLGVIAGAQGVFTPATRSFAGLPSTGDRSRHAAYAA